jgi:AGZA family xanthine/uracil permease-like MFS transporter
MPTQMLERLFKLRENHTTIRAEVLGGATTFMTMSYIIFVQPVILSAAGMDKGAVMAATCVASAAAIFIMGFYANYPIALAPGMGHNVFFAYTVCVAMGVRWQVALGAVFLDGVLFILLAQFGFREKLMEVIPESLKGAIAAGIGLLIAMVGFQWAGIIVDNPAVLVQLGPLHTPPVALAIFGTLLIAVLMVRKIHGAILIGTVVTALVGLPFGLVEYHGIVSKPPSLAATAFHFEIARVLTDPKLWEVVLIMLFLDIFDTVGTLVGVAERAGFLVGGKLPRAKQAFLADAAGTVIGAVCGTSTITSYIESAAGVTSGARTGLANVVTGILFLAALFFSPLISMFGGGHAMENGAVLYPVIAPALIIVGSMMLQSIRLVKWEDPTELVPAFLTAVAMPLTMSITEGMAFGFISYSLFKTVRGEGKQVHWLLHLFAVLFVLRYLFLHE